MTDDKTVRRISDFDALHASLVNKRNAAYSHLSRVSNRKKRRHTRLVIALTLISLCFFAGAWFTNGYLWRLPASTANAAHRAAIIDELSLTYSDPYFLDNVTQTLKSAGYSVDYYPPSQVTVRLFQDLPGRDYGLIIIRSHTASSAGIITAEAYTQNKYVYDQLTNQLVQGVVPPSRQTYFAIEAGFVGAEMKGQFPDSTIVLMGCAGLQGNHQLAEAFIDKGAKFFVGWTNAVSATQTDIGVSVLIQEIARGATVSKAVGVASQYPDLVYNSHLDYISWDQVSGQQLNAFLYALTGWSSIVGLLIIGPAVVILIPKLLSRR